jgi:hypothetical protein
VTTPYRQPGNVASDRSQVGVQAVNAHFDMITLPGDVQLTVGQDASPEAKYRAGVENLKSGNPRMARKLIWDAMMSDYMNNQVLFHWLIAMLSGRTVRQFSTEEVDQLKRSRCRYDENAGDAWADGVALIYRLLDSALPSLAAEAGQRTADTDMSLLVMQFDDLGEEQRDLVRPHLELFLSGPLRDEMWRQELQLAHSQQLDGGRPGRAWMFFQPIPAEVLLPPPRPESIRPADRLLIRASTWIFAAVAGYLGWELLWHGAFLGLLASVAALTGGAVGAVGDLRWRFLTERRHRKDEQFRAPGPPTPRPTADALTDQVNKLFKRYFARSARDKAEHQRWEEATAGIRNFYTDEVIEICRASGIPANQVAWFIRYEVRQLKRRWQNQTLHEYRWQLLPPPGTTAARRIGLIVLVIGGVWAITALLAHPLADTAAVLSALCAWRCWLRINLERRRYDADSEEHAQRQAAIDEEYRRWSQKLEARPTDADMAAWLGCDRTILLGAALDHFHLPRSRLNVHGFLEEPGVAVKRARIEGGPVRYAKYRLRTFLLAEDGVREVRADLDFVTGTLAIRERNSYRYDAIVSVRVLKDSRPGHTFELRLTAGDPITIHVRDAEPAEAQQGQEPLPADETHAAQAEQDDTPDGTSMTDLLHILEGIAGQGRSWFQEQDWSKPRPSDDNADPEEEYV